MAQHPKFLIKQAKNGQFYFNLTAKNGQVIATSEMYTTKAACKQGIEAVKDSSPPAELEVMQDNIEKNILCPLCGMETSASSDQIEKILKNRNKAINQCNDLIVVIEALVENYRRRHNSLNDDEKECLGLLVKLKETLNNTSISLSEIITLDDLASIDQIKDFDEIGDVSEVNANLEKLNSTLSEACEKFLVKTITSVGPNLVENTGVMTVCLGVTAILSVMGVPIAAAAATVFGSNALVALAKK